MGIRTLPEVSSRDACPDLAVRHILGYHGTHAHEGTRADGAGLADQSASTEVGTSADVSVAAQRHARCERREVGYDAVMSHGDMRHDRHM